MERLISIYVAYFSNGVYSAFLFFTLFWKSWLGMNPGWYKIFLNVVWTFFNLVVCSIWLVQFCSHINIFVVFVERLLKNILNFNFWYLEISNCGRTNAEASVLYAISKRWQCIMQIVLRLRWWNNYFSLWNILEHLYLLNWHGWLLLVLYLF